MAKTIAEINEKIKRGKAVVLTAEEIIDYAVADGGEVIYAIVYSDFTGCDGIDSPDDSDYYLLKSEDGGATWTDIYDPIQDLIDRHLVVTPYLVDGWWKDTGKLEDLLEVGEGLTLP
jgi:NDP-sugar pyrophosphorylase family protein